MLSNYVNHFHSPWVLFLLPVPLILLGWNLWRRHHRPAVVYSDLSLAANLPKSMRQRVEVLLPVVRALALCLGIIALARPQFGTVEYTSTALGVEIALVMDVSGSMQERDYVPNRLEAAKKSAISFVRNRSGDRISVILFGSETATLLPPTLDMAAAELFLEAIYDGIIANQATAIGDGIGLALKRMEESDAPSKVILLLTDGDNNAGRLQPLQAAEMAKALGVRIHVIGLANAMRGGRQLGSILGQRQVYNPGFDEKPMEAIAEMTGGLYFRATDPESLTSIYNKIDEMEKNELEVEETKDFNERFMYFWFPGLGLLLFEFLLRALWLRRLP